MLDATLLPLIAQKVTLRAMQPGDAAPYAEGTTDAAVRTWGHLPEPEYTTDSVTALIAGPIAGGLERGDLAVLTIADPVTDAFAGSLVLFDVDADSAEVGFWIHPAHRGRGLTHAALTLAGEFARRSGLRHLRAHTVPENFASQRVLERGGFVAIGEQPGIAPSGTALELRSFARELRLPTQLPLTTPRLTLRPHERRDTGPLHGIYRRPEVARFLLEDPWTAAEAERQVSSRLPKVSLDDGEHALSLVIEHEDTVIGDVQLWLTDVERRVAEIGWVLDPTAGGKGLATEAVRAVLDHAFADAGMHRVAAQLDPRNEASARLAERAGMRPEAHLRQNWWSKGEWTDTAIYGALATDQR